MSRAPLTTLLLDAPAELLGVCGGAGIMALTALGVREAGVLDPPVEPAEGSPDDRPPVEVSHRSIAAPRTLSRVAHQQRAALGQMDGLLVSASPDPARDQQVRLQGQQSTGSLWVPTVNHALGCYRHFSEARERCVGGG